ncbi:hypothetical protein HMPREF1981_02114 [Bacteroides pyogenes F0041]|uniref:Uncharacterized protein n=1 Tax=Bacteroides pyogenes F0041 TaxID=1321819 RepID=U2DT49_9BACE|nr:hypothetical protein HMPREF1981_02114 [Bacteroides pyogenes F0041]
MVRKTGIVPKGLVKVKKEVRQSRANGKSAVSIILSFYALIIFRQKYD